MRDVRHGPEPGGARVKLAPTSTGAVRIEVHAKPRARKTRVVGVHGEALSVAVAAPPVDGAANEEIVRFLAELFEVPRSAVVLTRGASSRVPSATATST